MGVRGKQYNDPTSKVNIVENWSFPSFGATTRAAGMYSGMKKARASLEPSHDGDAKVRRYGAIGHTRPSCEFVGSDIDVQHSTEHEFTDTPPSHSQFVS